MVRPVIFDDPPHDRTFRALLLGWRVPTRHTHRNTTAVGVEQHEQMVRALRAAIRRAPSEHFDTQ